MGFTADDLAAIRTAIARGEQSVQFSDRMVTYRSMDDLLKAEKRIAAALSGTSKQTYGVASRGFTETSS